MGFVPGGKIPAQGTLLTWSLSAPPRHRHTRCPPGRQLLSMQMQDRKWLGYVTLSLSLCCGGKFGLLLITQPKGAKEMQKEPQGSQAASKGPAQGMMPGLAGCVYGQFSAWVWPSSSRDGAAAAAQPQLCAGASPGRAPNTRTWVWSLQTLLKAEVVPTPLM